MEARGRFDIRMVNGNFLKINSSDNVAVALKECDGIPFGHKKALRKITEGELIYKYGYPIGHATCDIECGEWVHSHNVSTNLEGLLEYSYTPEKITAGITDGFADTFMGYRRKDGRVGTRNEVWIVPTVSCVNKMAERLALEANSEFGNLCDGVFAFPHNAGCSQMGRDFETTQKILKSIIQHPNAGGVLILSLGCENNDLDHFLPILGEFDHRRIKTLITQEYDGDEFEKALELLKELALEIKDDRREEISVSELIIGFKCGGSDAFSGIAANPLCGYISDAVTSLGGSALLTEVPEMFGAEQLLMNRADSKDTFLKIVDLINGFKNYYIGYNQPIDDNPSPGNKKGGITTLEEKSLGCIQKGGHSTIVDTLDYGEICTKKGLNLVNGPGNDNVSITNLLAAGAQVVLFTTGRGNPLGTAVPTLKIASNTVLFKRKKNWIDFNAGVVLEGTCFEDAAKELWQMMIDVISGKEQTKCELHNYKEIMLFKNGVML